MSEEKGILESRDEFERQDLLDSIWCENCGRANGVEDPKEFESEGLVYLEATCQACGEEVVARIDVLAD